MKLPQLHENVFLFVTYPYIIELQGS